MKNLYITSTRGRVGKSTFAIALSLHLKAKGINVGYFKPITDRDEDTDAAHARSLLKMEEPIDVISPTVISRWEYDMDEGEVSTKLAKVRNAYQSLSTNYDILVIEGCNSMNYLSSLRMSPKELVSEFNAELVLLASVADETYLDEVVLGISYFNPSKVGGVVVTMVPLELIERVKFLVKKLESLGARVLGIIPEKGDLTAPTAREVCKSIDAHILSGRDYLDTRIVEDYKVAAMDVENALKIMRKSINKAVIVGGDRPTLAIAAMETDTSLVILTGGIYPPVSLLSLSEEKKIPIALVQMDTYSLVQHISLNPVQGVLSILQTDRIENWMKIVSSLNVEELIS